MNRSTVAAAAPLELPRLVMRRASWVALAALLLALALGLWRSAADIDEETRSAMALATALTGIVDGAERDEAELQATLERLRGDDSLRHIRLTLHDAQSRLVFDSAATKAAQDAPPAWWGWLDRPWQRDAAPPSQRISLPRPAGADWTLHVSPARDSERREAMSGLVQMLLMVAAGSAAMLAVMAWNMRRAFAPLRSLVDAIESMRSGGASATSTALALATPMPIRELQSISQALQGLQQALHGEATQRRLLSQQLLTLQEDERQRLARELHDEFGQQLTGLRVDAVWLAQRLAHEPQQQGVAQAIAERCAAIQLDIRSLLTRLQPLAASAGHEPASRLADLLQALVHGWGRSATQTCAFELRLVTLHADGGEAPWPGIDDDAALLPRELALAIYRISQEALTNVARHARATRAVLSLAWCVDADGNAQAVDWALSDDGVGLPDPVQALQRGTGLAGLKERAWAQGAELEFFAGEPHGLRLTARFAIRAA